MGPTERITLDFVLRILAKDASTIRGDTFANAFTAARPFSADHPTRVVIFKHPNRSPINHAELGPWLTSGLLWMGSRRSFPWSGPVSLSRWAGKLQGPVSPPRHAITLYEFDREHVVRGIFLSPLYHFYSSTLLRTYYSNRSGSVPGLSPLLPPDGTPRYNDRPGPR
jgi:hypothetical protein